MKEYYIGTNRIVTDHDKQRTMLEWYVRGGSGLTLRLWRRWQTERMRRRVKRLAVCYAPNDPRVVGRLLQTRRPCSCVFCQRHSGEIMAVRDMRKIEPTEFLAGGALSLRSGNWKAE